MTKAYLHLRTSADDRDRKARIEVQRAACTAYAARAGFEIVSEFVDDGVTGKLPMHSRPQGKLLIAALLGNGVNTVLCYDSMRIGRTQPAFWSFVGQCRDIGVTVLDKDGADLRDSLKGGFEGLMAEMDYKATIERLAAGKRANRRLKRVEGRWPYGEHPRHEYDGEREIVRRILKMRAKGEGVYAIAKKLNAEGTRTRYGCEFKVQTVQNIIARVSPKGKPVIGRVQYANQSCCPNSMKRSVAIRKEHKAVCAKMNELMREAAKAGWQGPLPKDERLYFELYRIKITLEWVYPSLIKTKSKGFDRLNELAGHRYYLAGPLHATLYP